MTDIELNWLTESDEEEQEVSDLLVAYYREIAKGPMTTYRHIKQSGHKQGQNYYTHALGGVNMIHKLRQAGVVAMNDLEEQLLFATYTIHDINKIPPYGGRENQSSYINVATHENIRRELTRIEFKRFFFEWETYLEDIRLLMLLHQHDAAPLYDLNQKKHKYQLRYERLLDLGRLLLYPIDNLDLSHTLEERNHKQEFLAKINTLSSRRWRWITHRLGENRAVLSNVAHNTVVSYLRERHKGMIIDLLYYPDGVAYLLPEREAFSWSSDDYHQVAQRLTQAIADKKVSSAAKFVKGGSGGIRVAEAAVESGASFADLLYIIRKIVEKKKVSATKHEEYLERLRGDIQAAAQHADQAVAVQANALLHSEQPIVPHVQGILQRGDLALAYFNILKDFLNEELGTRDQNKIWTRIYKLLNLPQEQYILYEQVNHYRRAPFVASKSADDFDSVFERFLADVATLTGEQQTSTTEESSDICAYLTLNLEIGGIGAPRDFLAHVQRYSEARDKQCCMCSSPLPSLELMAPEVPANMGVQVFSNRLRGGGGEPKRQVCPICRTQLILQKVTWSSFNRKTKSKTRSGEKANSELFTTFYLHLYPYAFFTAPYLEAMYATLKQICTEDNRCLFLKTDRYFIRWEGQLEQHLAGQAIKRAAQIAEEKEFAVIAPTKIKGISVPNFSEAVCNTPTLSINAFGENYSQQFLFALTHALMIADFFGCRLLLSRTPIPLLTSAYMSDQALTFFVDGVPLDWRWLLPANEYRSIETYREGTTPDGGQAYQQRKRHWGTEQADDQGYAAYENIHQRLSLLYRIARALRLAPEEEEDLMLEIASAAANDPFSIYYVVDMAIEKKIRNTKSSARRQQASQGNRSDNKQGDSFAGQISPEHLAISLHKRIAPLLAEITGEEFLWNH